MATLFEGSFDAPSADVMSWLRRYLDRAVALVDAARGTPPPITSVPWETATKPVFIRFSQHPCEQWDKFTRSVEQAVYEGRPVKVMYTRKHIVVATAVALSCKPRAWMPDPCVVTFEVDDSYVIPPYDVWGKPLSIRALSCRHRHVQLRKYNVSASSGEGSSETHRHAPPTDATASSADTEAAEFASHASTPTKHMLWWCKDCKSIIDFTAKLSGESDGVWLIANALNALTDGAEDFTADILKA
jgi:hypothetical protein